MFTKIDSESPIIRDVKTSTADKIISIIGAEDSESESDEEENKVKNLGDQHFEIGMNNDDDIQINIG